ncbi:glycosyl transferase [Leptospira perolatii]|uniref:Glycosyl transferase n=1 Tax=Leptospira perolatii TaxID=2023191 RepID=A0A2M9ZLS1_9LEPT|nr:glycosyltransferase [Leptospira perolatii]PJZ69820.1 glycosyl transferase [Leptospira perolatii]PJZ72965.1 glycosyl transferase [Leptospira perolatii]
MILHIDTETGWRGGERQLLLLAEGLKKKKIRQLIACKPGSAIEQKAISAGLDTIAIPLKSELDWGSIRTIRTLVQKNGIRLIHAHTAKAHSIAWMAKAKLPNVKLIVSRRVDFGIRKNLFSKWKYTSNRVDLFLAVSKKIREILIRDGVDPAKVITVYSGIDLGATKRISDTNHLRKEFKIGKNEVVIGNIAALVDHKDQRTLIRSISLLDADLKYKLLIVGEGNLRGQLENLVKEKGLQEKVIFTGFRKDVPELLSLIDIFTLTSKEEGLGTAVLDAMAVGLPIVATKGGGISEMLAEGEGAFLSEIGDFRSLSESFTKLIGAIKLRKSMGTFNKESVKKFSIKNTLNKTELVYFSLIGETLYSRGLKEEGVA